MPDRSFAQRFLSLLTDRYGRWALAGAALLLLTIVWWLSTGAARSGISDLDTVTDQLSTILTDALAAGIIALSLVEVMKRMTSIRGWFHRNEIESHLSSSSQRYEDAPAADSGDIAWGQLKRAIGHVWLTSRPNTKVSERLLSARDRRDWRYFFDLPLEQLMGQLASAIESSLNTPQEFEELLNALVGEAAPMEVEVLVGPIRTPPGPKASAEHEAGYETYVASFARAQAVVGDRVQRSLDALQVVIGHRWRWFLRATVMSICAVVALILVRVSGVNGTQALAALITITVLGSVVAWIGRDVMAVVERWRR